MRNTVTKALPFFSPATFFTLLGEESATFPMYNLDAYIISSRGASGASGGSGGSTLNFKLTVTLLLHF
jgi:hypothetical protein